MGGCLGKLGTGGNEVDEDDHEGTITGSKYGNKLTYKYIMGGLIGRGQFGTITQCTRKSDGRVFACKSLTKKNIKMEDKIADVRREVLILRMLKDHPHVVHFEEVFEDAASVHIIMEMCTGGSLTDHIGKQGEYGERAASRLMGTVVDLLRELHSKGVVHRDLKLSNFMLSDTSDTPILKAIDFGSAQFWKDGDPPMTHMEGSPMYVAPEVLDECYTRACDVWSAGIIMYTLLCGQPPFQGDSVLTIFEGIREKEPDLESSPWPLISESAKDLIRLMLAKDPTKRPTPEQVLEHPWILRVDSTSRRWDEEANLADILLPRMKKLSAMSNLRHMALMMTARYMQDDGAVSLRHVFDEVDTDKSGGLSLEELQEALGRVGAPLTEEETKKIFEFADLDKSGSIDYMEFSAATMVLQSDVHASAVRKAFEQMDENGDGQVSVDEFMQVCLKYRWSGSEEELRSMVQEAIHGYCGDDASTLDYKGFLSFVTGGDTDSGSKNWALMVL